MDTLEMAYSRKKAEQIITGLERPLNRHLVKLIGFEAAEATRAVWKKEVKRWLREIAAIRLKPNIARLKEADLHDWLYDEPFGGVELLNTRFLMEDAGEEFTARASAEVVAVRLRALHEALGPRLANGDAAGDLIDAL
jgi:hypothetical protein